MQEQSAVPMQKENRLVRSTFSEEKFLIVAVAHKLIMKQHCHAGLRKAEITLGCVTGTGFQRSIIFCSSYNTAFWNSALVLAVCHGN